MIFVYKKWDAFCHALDQKGIRSLPAREVTADLGAYVVLKHDVETDVARAFEMAKIEQRYGHRGSYYVQAYLMDNAENVKMLTEMQVMGHEISYHYDVMDSCKGDIDKAIAEFELNAGKFTENGFELKTLCQHGNPVVERVGYTSNRDFFRNERVKQLYPNLSDIMVDFKDKYRTDYLYFSDVGRRFQMIYDPINNDIENSDDKNIPYDDLDALLGAISSEKGNIISTHPHRWTRSATKYIIKSALFKLKPVGYRRSRYAYVGKRAV